MKRNIFAMLFLAVFKGFISLFNITLGLLFFLLMPLFGFIIFGWLGILVLILSWLIVVSTIANSSDSETSRHSSGTTSSSNAEIEEAIVSSIIYDRWSAENESLYYWYWYADADLQKYATLKEYISAYVAAIEQLYVNDPANDVFTRVRYAVIPRNFKELENLDTFFWYYGSLAESVGKNGIKEFWKIIRPSGTRRLSLKILVCLMP